MIDEYQQKLLKAVRLYKARYKKQSLPDGHVGASGIFILSNNEKRKCCYDIVPANSEYKKSAMQHACSKAHIANLCGVDVADLESLLRKKRRLMKQQRKCRMTNTCKAEECN